MVLRRARPTANQRRPRYGGDPFCVGREMESRFRRKDESGRDLWQSHRRSCAQRKRNLLLFSVRDSSLYSE